VLSCLRLHESSKIYWNANVKLIITQTYKYDKKMRLQYLISMPLGMVADERAFLGDKIGLHGLLNPEDEGSMIPQNEGEI